MNPNWCPFPPRSASTTQSAVPSTSPINEVTEDSEDQKAADHYQANPRIQVIFLQTKSVVVWLVLYVFRIVLICRKDVKKLRRNTPASCLTRGANSCHSWLMIPPVLNQGSRMKMDKAQTFQRNKEPRALLNPLLLCSNKHLVQLKVCRKRQFMRILKYPTPLKYFKYPTPLKYFKIP